MGIDALKDKFLRSAARFNYPEGRYNYYPRITSWENNLEEAMWFSQITHLENKEIDLYIHIPFCARFCFFCGCNIKAGKAENLIDHYIDNLLQEWHEYERFDFKIVNIYFGGGTPNSLNQEQFVKILGRFPDGYKIHLEYDPRFHNNSLLEFLKSKGLKSISMGIQDLDPTVLASIGRPTNLDEIKSCLSDIEKLQIEHVGIDIIYGLPNQKQNSFDLLSNFLKDHHVISGISLYPFAEVPWFKEYNPNWKKNENHAQEKSLQFFNFSKIFEENNFELISFGHYFKKDSALHKSYHENSLERTIMGFCTKKSETLIGLGVSAISSTTGTIKQNHKIFENYMKWPSTIYTGHIKSDEEKVKELIYLEISSKKEFNFKDSKIVKELMDNEFIQKDDNNNYSFTVLGKHFLQYNIQQISTAYST